ncbi:MAG: hypothetical protein MHMPM18_000123 [Marteilia pararefringens]
MKSVLLASLLLLTFLILTIIFHWQIAADLKSPAILLSIANFLLNSALICLVIFDIFAVLYETCSDSPNEAQSKNCENYSALYTSTHIRSFAIRIIYFCLALNAYLFIPFIRTFISSGHRLVRDRVFDSIRHNLVYYAVLLSIVLAAVVVIKLVASSARFSHQFMETVVQIINLLGFIFLTALLAYSFVFITSKLLIMLSPCREIIDYLTRFNRCHSNSSLLKFEIQKNMNMLNTQRRIFVSSGNKIALKEVQDFVANLPRSLLIALGVDATFSKEVNSADNNLTQPGPHQIVELSMLKRDIIKQINSYLHAHAITVQCIAFLRKFSDDDIAKSINNHVLAMEESLPRKIQLYDIRMTLKFFYVLSLLLIFLTFVSTIFLSIFTIRIATSFSLFEHLFNSTEHKALALILIFLLFIICLLFSISNFEIFEYYMINYCHSSDETSILYLTNFFSTVVPTLCFFILTMLNIDSSHNKNLSHNTQFQEYMGKYNGRPIVANYTPYLFPILLSFFTLLFTTNCFKYYINKINLVIPKDLDSMFSMYKIARQKNYDEI